MNRIAGLRDYLTLRNVPFACASVARTPSPTELCTVCLQMVASEGWSPEPVPTCRLCWPLLSWFRGLYADFESPELTAGFSTETRFIDLGADSLDYIEFVMEAEQAFDITIPDREAERLRTVGEFLREIRRPRVDGGKAVWPPLKPRANLWDRELDG